ncbi:stage III sporulation protein AF [Acetivibrio clariflavus]|uniref:Stage III sporulation protein AF n=1 Tax=Acetivibrio clariflavus (strain DSM 19732 / NBRC 101661 / EBR45) TaxID=720554 RepID=G8LWJ9_ACECE|nr:stage III sporulation protein AF [Acetivibrio clariflavus]AEV68667.1 stage III sporulation protein AF [Acetivibrio clariflavus DSM 19732]
MIEFLKEWCLNIAALVIFIVLLEMLLPSEKMKKMVNLVSGLILVIALINPVLGFLQRGIDLEVYQMSSSNFIDKKEIMANSQVLREEQTRQITDLYRNKVISQVESLVREVKGVLDVKADVIINDDYSDEKFGEVKRIYLELKLGEEDEKAKGIEKVKSIDKVKIVVGKEKKQESEEWTNTKIDEEIRKEIEKRIENMLNIQKENIVISVT